MIQSQVCLKEVSLCAFEELLHAIEKVIQSNLEADIGYLVNGRRAVIASAGLSICEFIKSTELAGGWVSS